MLKNCFISLLVLLLPILAFGQFTVSGNVLDKDDNAILYGDVILSLDSTISKFSYIDSGYFELPPVAAGSYQFEIKALGYKSYLKSITIVGDSHLDIWLTEDIETLEEITVSASRNPISYSGGNLTTQIANTQFALQPSMTELIQMLPRVQLSPDGESFSVIGRGSPLIYLDQQRIPIQQFLAIPVQQIEKIEMVINPSAKYEAEGRSVIIVTRKKNIDNGYTINLSETASWRRKFNNYGQADFNLKQNRLETRLNLGYNHLGFWESVASDYQVLDFGIRAQSRGLSTGLRPQLIAGGGIHYSLPNDSYISGQVNTRLQEDNFPLTSAANITRPLESNSIESFIENSARRKFLNANINYFKKLDQWKAGLFLGMGYSYHLRDLFNNIFVNIDNTGQERIEERGQQYDVNGYSFRGDFEKEITANVKIELGLNLYWAEADAFTDILSLVGEPVINSIYDYQESNMAFYSQISGSVQKLSYSVGLRSETNDVLATFENESPIIDRKKTNLFPRITATYQFNDQWRATINYGTTIRRPNFLNASSITTFINPFLEFSRNPSLLPNMNEEVSLNLNYKSHNLGFELFERTGVVVYSPLYDPAIDRLVSSPQNFESSRGLNISYNLPVNYKSWNMSYTLLLNWNQIQDPCGVLGISRPYLYFYTNHRWKVGQTGSIGLNFWGMTRRKEGIYDRNSLTVLNLSASKKFFEKLNLSLQINDLFRGLIYKDRYNIKGIESFDTYFIDFKAYAISLQYNFGKTFKSNYKNKEVDEQLNRMR